MTLENTETAESDSMAHGTAALDMPKENEDTADSFIYRATDWLRNTPVGQDFEASGHKLKTSLTALGTAATQLVGLTKLPLVIGPAATANILEATHSAPVTGTAVAASYGAWTLFVTNVVHRSTIEFPNTYEATGAKHPLFLKATKSLPGLIKKNEDHLSWHRRTRNFVNRQIWRGLTAFTLTAAGYPVAASMHGRPEQEINGLNRAVAADAGLVAGALSFTEAEALEVIGHSNPTSMHAFEHLVSNHYLQMGAMVGAIALKVGVEKLKSKRSDVSSYADE